MDIKIKTGRDRGEDQSGETLSLVRFNIGSTLNNLVNESFIISQIMDCPMVEVEGDHTTGLILSAVEEAGVTVASSPQVGSTATLALSENQPGWRLFPPVDLSRRKVFHY